MGSVSRFDDREDTQWAEGAFFDGGVAWTRKVPLTQNPHEVGTWAYKSWTAGWADADAGQEANTKGDNKDEEFVR